MNIFELDAAGREACGAGWTITEIAHQPRVWRDIAAAHGQQQHDLNAFLAPLLRRPDLRIVLTGAGTSAFVGECLRAPLALRTGRRVEAIATTDIIAAPLSFLEPRTPTLMVHFARSGDSPESVATFDLAARHVRDCYHLVVTCNAHGALYARARDRDREHSILLPPAAHDRGFAMTSSFTGMLLATALAFGILDGRDVAGIATVGESLLCKWPPLVASIANAGFERVVYLGSDTLKGIAREAALKLLELTDGKVVAIGDSPLAFRHGPKTFLDRSTLVIVLLSNDRHTRQYDLDLLRELRREGVAGRVLSLSGQPWTPDSPALAPASGTTTSQAIGERCDDLVLPVIAEQPLTDLGLCLPIAIWAQSLAMLRSLSLGLTPDRPHAAGTVSRVVQGVTVHAFGEDA